MDITLNAKKLTLKMFLSIEESLSTTLEMKNIKKNRQKKNTSQHNTPNTQYTSTEKRSSD